MDLKNLGKMLKKLDDNKVSLLKLSQARAYYIIVHQNNRVVKEIVTYQITESGELFQDELFNILDQSAININNLNEKVNMEQLIEELLYDDESPLQNLVIVKCL